MFSIDESTGWVSVASQLTYGSFLFNITAMDHGTPRLSDTVTVKIIVEVSAGPPRFSYVGFPGGFHASVHENKERGTSVLKATAVSKDIVSYALYETNVTDFRVDTITGEITTTKPLDYENIKYYEFTVSATDRSERISLAHVRIDVLNTNDNKPQILNKDRNNQISCRIDQDSPPGSLVNRIHAQDLDNDHLSFSLTQNTKSVLFKIDSVGNILTVRSLKGIKNKIYLAVTVRDNGSPMLEDTVTVDVVVVNYGNRLVSLFAEVSEDTNVGKDISVSPQIAPRYKSTQYVLIYPPGSPFDIHGTSGTLSLKKRLDYEKCHNYSLTVRLQESVNNNNYFDVDIRIDVKDENDNRPQFVPPGDLHVPGFTAPGHSYPLGNLRPLEVVPPGNLNSCESPVGYKIHPNAKRGSVVYHFQAIDRDSGLNGEIRYVMEECRHCMDLFSLDLNTGVLRTTGVSLTKPQYKITIAVYDRGIPSQSTRGCILVLAGNPWKPQFTKEEYHFELDESADIGQRVGMVEAQGYGVAVSYELHSKSKIDLCVTLERLHHILLGILLHVS